MDPQMTANLVNDWHRLAKGLGPEHTHVLKGTLPTISLRLLLEAQIRDCKQRLTELDLSRDATVFKERYRSVRLQQDLAESFLDFVQSLAVEPA